MAFKTIFILLIIIVTIAATRDKKDKGDDELFVPTENWQIVKKGQKIPRGLHVRVNLETGITEAKLLDTDNSHSDKNKALLEVPQEDIKIELSDTGSTEAKTSDDILRPEDIKKTKEKFRSYEELKEDMSALNLTPKIDAEVLKDLFSQFGDEMKNDKVDVNVILRILEDLDFLAHQFDNALEFVRQNGFKDIIYKNLNLSDTQVKQETLKLFGSLVQNNGKVQIHALETGGVNVLLKILNLEPSVDVKSRAIYALSCLLRRFPLAQLRFVENGGISVVTKILEHDPIKIQTKLITFLNDLLIENIQALQEESETYNLASSQYKLVNLENILLEQGWCQYLNKLLYSLLATDPDDHDSIEKCLLAMHTTANKCIRQYSTDILIKLKARYKNLALTDLKRSDDFNNSDFFTNLHDLCVDMLQKKKIKTEL